MTGPSTATIALGAAICCEVVGTSFLKQSESFTRPLATAVTIVSYSGAFYGLTVALRTMPIGIVYAVWSGLGIVLISAIGVVAFGQKLDGPALLGLGLIVAGVLVVNLFSHSTVE